VLACVSALPGVVRCTASAVPNDRAPSSSSVRVEISNSNSDLCLIPPHHNPDLSHLMPAVASSAPPQRPPPGDADLQELYDQVLSAFADETSPSNFSSPTFSANMSNNVEYDDSVYSPHSDEGVASPTSSRTHPQPRRQSFAPLFLFFLSSSLFPSLLAAASPRDNNNSLSSPTAFSSSPVGKGRRPLPRPPGSSPNISSHYPTHMPDPHIEPPPPASTCSKPYPEQCVTPNILPCFTCHPCV
jgi:hypothetical protein